jgi:CRISPR-associated endoribonuclease Cas6
MSSNAAASIDLSPLHSLRFARFTFDLEATEDLHLPQYKGSTFRGGFGNALKKALCMTKTFDCPPCLLKHTCHYISVFEPKIDKMVADLLRIGRDAPQPFVLEPPLTDQRQFKKGERLSVGLVLIGRVMELLPSIVYAFTVFGERVGLGTAKGKFAVRRMTDADGAVVFDGKTFTGDFRVMTFPEFLHSNGSPQSVTMQFLTPTRIMTSHGNSRRHLMRLRTTDDLWTFIETLYHRLFVLTNLYCLSDIQPYTAKRIPLNSRQLSLSNVDIGWMDWERYSNRQHIPMKLGGFVGQITLKGEVDDLLPLLRIGEYLHVGKGTSFGLGQFKLVHRSADE